MTADTNARAEKEKRRAALSSVVAAVFLTTLKLVVGLMTGSLGILAEAAHSGLDLVAALVTFFAVRIADRPPDDRYRYGYGKVENLSALIETLLLLITCIWIIYEAIQRLFFKSVEIEASIWAFGVMAVSIVVDVSRSRLLYHVARKHNSQALEADALHFSTDIWSSAVVIVGLGLVWISERLGQEWAREGNWPSFGANRYAPPSTPASSASKSSASWPTPRLCVKSLTPAIQTPMRMVMSSTPISTCPSRW